MYLKIMVAILGTFENHGNHVWSRLKITSPTWQYFPVSCKSNPYQNTRKSAMQFVLKFVKNQCQRHPRVINLPESTLKNLKGSNYACTRRMWESCSAQQVRPLDLRISQQRLQSHIRFWRKIVRRDRQDALKRRRGPKSLRRARRRSWFRMLASCSESEEATPWFAIISTMPRRFRARIGAQGPPRCPWKMARSEIHPRRGFVFQTA